jgi:hypothetical protein
MPPEKRRESGGSHMVVIRGYELILGTAVLISFFITGIVVAGYSPESVIPRESICSVPVPGENWLAGYPDAMIAYTGTDAGSIRFSQLRAMIGMDGLPVSIDLNFFGTKNGTNRLYQVSYRQGQGSCGWLDGLVYHEGSGALPDPLPVDPARALFAIGQIRFSDLGLSGRYLVLETSSLRTPAEGTGDGSVPEMILFENGTPVTSGVAGAGTDNLMPFILLVSEKTCMAVQDTQCSTSPLMQIRFVDAG